MGFLWEKFSLIFTTGLNKAGSQGAAKGKFLPESFDRDRLPFFIVIVPIACYDRSLLNA
ncbi:MAG: hypothetical protein F6J93_26465 [Oscillatoria sp. SIO1A7]|nr:hypothetical protein [Oscillatoria sp. SIO1A7]